MDDGPALRRRTASGWPSCPAAWDATNAPTPVLTSRNMTTKTGSKEGKHGVFFVDLPHFLQKSGDFFAAPPNNRQKKRFTVLQ